MTIKKVKFISYINKMYHFGIYYIHMQNIHKIV